MKEYSSNKKKFILANKALSVYLERAERVEGELRERESSNTLDISHPWPPDVFLKRTLLFQVGMTINSVAQEISDTGYGSPGLRDEVYIQLCKQVSDNPRRESLRRGWELLGQY